MSDNPLVFWDIAENTSSYKNTAPKEAEEIALYAKEHPQKSIGVITPFANQKDYINEVLKLNHVDNVTCGTVHAFQGDEKDVILFSLALTDQTSQKTYDWLKNNKELINVATSRAREQLILISSKKELERLHTDEADDMYELAGYVATEGQTQVTARANASRALGIKPYSNATEQAFLTNLNHALGNVLNTEQRCTVKREVEITQILPPQCGNLFYTDRFDFVVFEQDRKKREYPVLAIELEGRGHHEEGTAGERERRKDEICRKHGFELIRVENSYARRYYYMKEILIRYFKR